MSAHRTWQRIGVAALGALFVTCADAGLRLESPDRVGAILIHDAPPEVLAPLVETLKIRLGATEVEQLVGSQLHAEQVESALRRRRDALIPHDTLLVYVGLPLAASGVDILATAGFDESKPWTGLPVESVLAALVPPPDAAVVVIFPSCGYQRTGENVLSKWPATGVAFCVAKSELPKVPAALNDAIVDAAGSALQGTSGITGLTRPVLSNWEIAQTLADHLRRRVAPTAQQVEGQMARPVGTTRLVLRQPSDANAPSQLAADLASDSPPMAPAKRFAWWVDRYRTQSVAVDSLIADLVRIARSPEYAKHAVLAVRALAELPPEHHREPLSDIFSTATTVEVKRECILHFSYPLPDDLLTEALRSKHSRLRSAIFERALLRKEPAFFIVARDAALGDTDEQVRIMALRAATTLATPTEALSVVQAVAAGRVSRPLTPSLTNELMVALGPLPKTSEAIEILLDAIDRGESSTQALALYALGNAQRQDLQASEALVMELLKARLQHGNAAIRTAALKTVGRLGYFELGEPVLQALRNAQAAEAERAAAIDALGILGVAAAVPELTQIACLRSDLVAPCSDSASLRTGAIAALGKIASQDAVDALWQGVSSPSPETRRQAIAALEPVASESGETVRRLGSDSTAEERALAIKMLSATGHKLEVLVDSLADPDVRVREAALLGLQQKGKRSPVIDRMIFERAASAQDPFERAAYVAAIGRLGDVEGLTRLQDAPRINTDTLIAGAAELPAEATLRLDPPEVSRWVRTAESPQARSAGIQVMLRALDCELNCPDGTPEDRATALKQWEAMAKDDPDAAVREAAAASIRKAFDRWD